MMLVCYLLLTLYLQDGQLGLELSYISENLPAVRTIAKNWTCAGLLVSRVKDVIDVKDLVPDLVKINQYQILAANGEVLDGSACTITEAYIRTAEKYAIR